MSSIMIVNSDAKERNLMDVLEATVERPRSTNRVRKICEVLKNNCQLLAIVVAVVLGFIIGILVHDAVQQSTDPPTEEVVMYIKFLGNIFIRMLRMIILPLTISSIVVALAEIDTNSAGKLGKRTFVYYLTTTIFACVLGVVLVKSIKPGEDGSDEQEAGGSNQLSALDSFLDLLRNLFPDNLVEAALRSSQTTYIGKQVGFKYEKRNISDYNSSAEEVSAFLKKNTVLPWGAGNNQQITVISNGVRYTYGGTVKKTGTNVMGLIVFSIALGIIIRKLGEDGQPLLNFFKSLFKAVMMLITAIMWISPVGILSLIAGSLAEVEDILGTFRDVALYVATVIIGIFIQSFLVYPLLYFIMVRKNPFIYLSGLIPAIVTAFGTSSSSATLPVTIRCVTENNKVDRRVAQFVLPIGATCNMDGSALYFAVTVIFIANLESVSLTFGELVLTVLVSVFVSAGASGIPSAGLSYTILCLEAVGLPTRHIGLIFAIDWIVNGGPAWEKFIAMGSLIGPLYIMTSLEECLRKATNQALGTRDRAQTVNNVMGDAYGAGLISHISIADLHFSDSKQLPENGNIESDKTSVSKPSGDTCITIDTSF